MVQPVRKGRQDLLGPLVRWGRSGRRDRRGWMEPKARWGHKDPRALKASKARLGYRMPTAHKVPRAYKAPQELTVLPALRDLQVHKGLPVPMARLAHKGRRGRLVRKALQVWTVPKVPKAHKESPASKAPQGQTVLRESQVSKARRDHRGLKVQPATMALPARKVRKV